MYSHTMVSRFAALRVATLTVGLVCAWLPTTSQGVLLNLSEAPLFLSSNVKPNILLLVDDSGSMRWMTLYRDGTGQSNAGGITNLSFNPGNSDERMRLCNGWNALAYDPAYTYSPWRGVDNANVPYQHAYLYGGGTEAAPNWSVRNDPFDPGAGTFNVNTVTVAYFPWSDGANTGRFDAGECGDTGGVKNDNTGAVAWGSMTLDQRKNYANWYSYYRNRNHVLKRALTELVQDSAARMGLGTLWNHNGVGTPIANIDDLTLPVDATNQANKQTLMRNVSRIGYSNGTPLRDALDAAGQYFEGIAQTRLFGALPAHTGTINPLSPILNAASGGACQKNFTILMTDGMYNSGYAGTNVGNADGNSSSAYDSSSAGAGARPFGDSQSDTLGDIAMNYYERDLQPGLPNQVTTTTADPNDAQHMVTYTVAFGLRGNLDHFNQTPTACDSDPRDACFVGWPNQTPASMEDTPAALDDLWHAAYNGRGDYYNAGNARTLIDSLKAAIRDIGQRTDTASAVAVNSGSLYAGSRVYVPQFISTNGRWSGSLLQKEILAPQTPGNLTDSYVLRDINFANGTATNDAGVILENTLWSSRNIITYNTSTRTGVEFRWPSLSAAQQNALSTNPSTLAVEAAPAGSNRLEYLRGNHANEQRFSGTLRDRDGFVLGAITDSSPVYVALPNWDYPDSLESVAYHSYRYAQRNRRPMIYVGANDGMLHGFDALTGDERIAYVPGAVYSRLSRLTNPGYAETQYVNDTPNVADVFYNGAWHTILVGGLRGGGQGMYALDVTDPGSFSEGNAASIVRWEFTDVDDADLGYTYGQPSVVRLTNGRYAAIFGNGYNNSDADTNPSVTGYAALYVVDMENGSLIRKLTVPVGSTATPNGLTTPTVVDYNGDRVADLVYAGDLQGNLWKFDIHDTTPANWQMVGFSGGTNPLFRARDAGNAAQPITSAPLVTGHPNGQGGLMVFFGTGKYIEGGGIDIGNTQTQTFYAVWDRQGSITSASYPTVTRAELLAQTLSAPSGTLGARVRNSSNTALTYGPQSGSLGAGQYFGWRIDLNISRERVVSTPIFLDDDRVLFFSIIPDTNPCSAGGYSWVHQYLYSNGASPPRSVFDTNQDGVFDVNDYSNSAVVSSVERGGIYTGGPIVQSPSGDNVILDEQGGRVAPGGTDERRWSWREIAR